MGKEEHDDNQDLETTAYLELQEETGYPSLLQSNKRIVLDRYVATPFWVKVGRHMMSKQQRFYYFPNFVHKIDPKFQNHMKLSVTFGLK